MKCSKKILHLNSFYYKGGAETVFRYTYSNISKIQKYISFLGHSQADYENHLFLESYKNKNIFKSIFNYIFLYKNKKKIEEFIEKNNIDIIHMHNYSELSPAILLALKNKKNKIKIIQTVHDYHMVCPNNSLFDFKKNCICKYCLQSKKKFLSLLKDCEKRGMKYLLLKNITTYISQSILKQSKILDKIIVPSIFLKNILINEGIESKKIIVIGNPIELNINSNIEIQKRENMFVYFGRIEKEKNIDEIIESFIKFNEISLNKYKLKIIGAGEQLKDLRDKVKRLKIEKDVLFLGELNKKDLSKELENCKISIMASKWLETFGLTPLESIAHGIIPVVKNSGATSEVFNKIKIGELFDTTQELFEVLQKIDKQYESYYSATRFVIKNYNLLKGA